MIKRTIAWLLALAVVVACATWVAVLVAGIAEDGSPGVTPEGYEQIHPGMSLDEVTAVMGQMPLYTSGDGGIGSAGWQGHEFVITVRYGTHGERVLDKSIRRLPRKPLLDRVRAKLHW